MSTSSDTHGSHGSHGADVDRPSGRRPGLRTATLIAVVVALVLVVGAGFLVMRLLGGGGAQAAEALPGDTVAYVGVDFDPPAGQKIEIYQFIRSFPAAREEISSEDDVKSSLLEDVLADSGCGLDFAQDVAPWLGQRGAFAARSVDGEIVPLLSLQVTDAEAAQAALDDLPADCELGLDGVVVDGDYALLAPTQAAADAAAAAAAEGDLASDETFTRWMGETGDDGVIEAYAAPEAGAVLRDEISGVLGELAAPGLAGDPQTNRQLEEFADAFTGAAATLRFEDGTAELVAAIGDETAKPADTTSGAGDLPGTTAIAFSVAASPEMARLGQQLERNPAFALLAQAGAGAGLDLPGDLLTLIGSGVSVTVDNSVVEAATPLVEGDAAVDPSTVKLPIGVLTTTARDESTDDVTGVVEKLRPLVAPATLTTEVDGDRVAWGSDPAWLQSLMDPSGTLSDNDRFVQVAPDHERAQSVVFVDLGGQAVDDLVAQIQQDAPKEARELREVVGPISGVGITGTTEDQVTTLRVRVGTE